MADNTTLNQSSGGDTIRNVAKTATSAKTQVVLLDLGSYPYYRPAGNGVAIIAKGNDPAEAEAAIAEVSALMAALAATPIQGEPPM